MILRIFTDLLQSYKLDLDDFHIINNEYIVFDLMPIDDTARQRVFDFFNTLLGLYVEVKVVNAHNLLEEMVIFHTFESERKLDRHYIKLKGRIQAEEKQIQVSWEKEGF